MGIAKIIAKTVGLLQTIIGGASLIFAFMLFYNFFNVQFLLGFSGENIALYMLVFIIYGLFSVISGLLLFYRQ